MKLLILILILIFLCLLIPLLSGGIRKETEEFRNLLAIKIFKSLVMLVLIFGIPIAIIFTILITIESSPSPQPLYDKEKAQACLDSGGGWNLTGDQQNYWCNPNADYYRDETGELVNKDESLNY